MIFPKAKKIAKELDWHTKNDGVFGLYKDYFFNIGDASLLNNPQFKYIIATVDNLTEEQKLQIKTELDANKKLLKFTTFEIEDNSIFIQFIETWSYTKSQTIYSLFDFLIELFTKLNIPKQNKCHNCSSKDNFNYYDQNDNGVLLCNSCLRQIENNYYEIEREKFSSEKNYLTGFIGSVIFSIPAIIAWVLVAVYLERLASAMAIAIALLGIKGYEYFKGQHSKFTKYVIVLSNILSILIANFITIIALLMQEGLSLEQSVTELQTNEVVKDILFKDLMISFVLAFFTWVWLLFYLKDKKLFVKPASKLKT